jgi:hypothetical protein
MTEHLPLAHPVLDTYLLGCVTGCSIAAALFFLRFWRKWRDPIFLAFTAFLFFQALRESAVVDIPHPNEGSFWFFVIRAISLLCVLAAILWKNFFESR